MKSVPIILVVIAALCVPSCGPYKRVVETDQSVDLKFVDTTKVVNDSTGHNTTLIDTTRTNVNYENSGIIEFVDGGGKVTVDNDGNITLEGVKNIKTKHKGSAVQEKGITHRSEDSVTHQERENGVEVKKNEQQKHTEECQPQTHWYEKTFNIIGQGVCIAVLMWLIFLYLRRKH